MSLLLDTPRRRHRVDPSPARTDARVRAGALVAVAVSLLFVTWLWIAGGGVGELADRADGLTSTGRWTGLAGSDLLLVQVLLMARIPGIERAVGQDRLARLHRLVGFTSFSLMLAHLGLITWGYAASRPAGIPGTFWDLTVSYPGMLLALVGTLCLVMVVVTSVRAARRRLRYESWHLLHLYAYLGVGLALPHQLWTGQEFLASTAATVYWWTLWAAALAAILLCRVGLPILRTLRHGLRVISVVPEDHDVVSVQVTGRHLDRLPVTAGQFLTWRFLSGRGWTRAHPYSLSAAPDGRSLRISVKHLGEAARWPGPSGRAPGSSSRDPTAGSPSDPGPGPRSPSSAPASASASPRCAPSPRACPTHQVTPCCCSVAPPGRCSRASSTYSSTSAGCGCCGCPAGAALPAPGSARAPVPPLTSPG